MTCSAFVLLHVEQIMPESESESFVGARCKDTFIISLLVNQNVMLRVGSGNLAA